MPGAGSMLVSQSHKFLKPVFIGDTITTTIAITNLIDKPAKGKIVVIMSITTVNQYGEVVATGEAVQLAPKKDNPRVYCIGEKSDVVSA